MIIGGITLPNSNVQRFTTRHVALTALKNSVVPQRLILGDDGYIWVVAPGIAVQLELSGYEYA